MRGTRPVTYRFFELEYLKYIQRILTRQWHLLQGGTDERATRLWLEVLWVLEIDNKGIADLFLLAHAGEAGRAEANEVLWNLLTVDALDPEYLDLSHLLTSRVHGARQHFERPPKTHRDRGAWNWDRYYEVRSRNCSSLTAPTRRGEYLPDERHHRTLPGGVPVPPPDCWPGD